MILDAVMPDMNGVQATRHILQECPGTNILLLAQGHSSKDIATELNISVYEVDAHRSRTMKKLMLRSVGDLVRFALQRGLGSRDLQCRIRV